MDYLVQILWNGIISGSFYALLALAFVLIYKSTHVINFAQGEIMMLGAYFGLFTILQLKLPLFIAFPVILICSTLLGIIVEHLICKPLIGESVFTIIIATIGLGVAIQGLVGLIWGHNSWGINIDSRSNVLDLTVIQVYQWDIIGVISAISIFLACFAFFKFTKIGISLKATASNQVTAMLMGINVNKSFILSWIGSTMIATIVGVILGISKMVDPSMYRIGIMAFPAIILGGLDSIPGAIIGGLLFGLIENIIVGYLDQYIIGSLKDVVSYLILVIILIIKPYGLFGTKEIRRV